ncbi:MAG: FAD:protein FMN transferase [Thermoguttaceae bacterium]|nr:FAD:protein FMN transferase [Thermoguttaceae bacterium]
MRGGVILAQELERYEFSEEKMGVPVRMILYASDERAAENAAEAVWLRFDEFNSVLSDYDPESEIIQACRRAGESSEPVAISDDLRKSLEEARRYCELTDGAFDVTVSPIVKLWRRSRYFHKRPPEDLLATAKKNVGLNAWAIDERGVRANEGVRFDVGGIAKGIALDEALETLQKRGICSALIDASGDLRVGAAPPGKQGWNVGVASLNDEPVCYCELKNVGICSSGDANRYLEIDGIRYSHIIDPRSGEPLTRRCVSAVIAPTATTADALASALCVLGGEEFLKVVERVKKEGLADRDGDFLLEFMLLQVKDGSEPPYSRDDVVTSASSYFQERISEKEGDSDNR